MFFAYMHAYREYVDLIDLTTLPDDSDTGSEIDELYLRFLLIFYPKLGNLQGIISWIVLACWFTVLVQSTLYGKYYSS